MAKKRNPSKKRNQLAVAVIRELGGPTATARIFGIKTPSISGWLEKGIPPARLMYLELAHPKAMRAARKINPEEEVDRAAASDDVQPPVGDVDPEAGS